MIVGSFFAADFTIIENAKNFIKDLPKGFSRQNLFSHLEYPNNKNNML